MRIRSRLPLSTVLAGAWIATAMGFVSPTSQPTRIIPGLKQAPPAGESGDVGQQQPDPVEAFMEDASAKGADKVRAMSIEERTRRAMLAEAVEDRIFSMYDDLENLLEDGVPASDEDREEIKNLAQEIKASQSQYEILVSGEPSAMLGTINDIGSNAEERSDSQRRNEQDDAEQ